MPLSNIAQLFIRLYAIKICVVTFSNMAGYIILPVPLGLLSGEFLYMILPSVFALLSAIALWQLAPFISKLLTKGDDRELSLNGLTSRDLYTATLLGLGVFFILSSLASCFSWVHFLIIYRRDVGGFHANGEPSYYDLADHLITLLAGTALTLTCRKWAERLAIQSEKPKVVPPSEEIG